MDLLVTKHYNDLLYVSKCITKKHMYLDKDISYNLLHNSISQIYEKLDVSNKFLNSDTDFLKYVNKYMTQQYNWAHYRMKDKKKDNFIFSFDFRYKDKEGIDITDKVIDEKNLNEIEEQLTTLECENIDGITKMYLKDLILNDIGIERHIKYLDVLKTAKTLQPIEYELFNLIYIEERTVRNIHRELLVKVKEDPLTYEALLKMVKKMKINLKEKLKNDFNY